MLLRTPAEQIPELLNNYANVEESILSSIDELVIFGGLPYTRHEMLAMTFSERKNIANIIKKKRSQTTS